MRGLAGIACARENNNDARRVEATPAGTLTGWRRWAEPQLASPATGLDEFICLHPLFPELDLPVWTVGNEKFKLVELLSRYANASELLLHDGTVDHDDGDDVASDRFRNSFEPTPGLILLPSFHPQDSTWAFALEPIPGYGRGAFPWFLGVSPINYVDRFEAELRNAWGEFMCEEDDLVVVGDVNGVEITRSVKRYCRFSA
jgi:hypothetical protein